MGTPVADAKLDEDFLFLVSLLILSIIERQLQVQEVAAAGSMGLPLGPWWAVYTTCSPPSHRAALWDLAKKHGPVMHLRLGQVDTLAVSSPAAAQEVLQANDPSFASRPSVLSSSSAIICYGNLDVAFAPYGNYWRALRKPCVWRLELLNARKVKQFAPIRDSETMSLVEQIRAGAARGEEEDTVNLGRLLVSCTNSITGLSTFRDACNGERKEQFLSSVAVALSVGWKTSRMQGRI